VTIKQKAQGRKLLKYPFFTHVRNKSRNENPNQKLIKHPSIPISGYADYFNSVVRLAKTQAQNTHQYPPYSYAGYLNMVIGIAKSK
jgi:hypothetical protein